MAIDISKYIDITSGVGGEAAVARRELIARVFTKSSELTSEQIVEYTSASAVMDKFGDDSDEYAFAVAYFGFISKSITKAGKISFAQYGDDSETPAEAVARVDAANDNFGTIVFIDSLTDEQATDVAEWNKAKNYKYLFSVPVAAAGAVAFPTHNIAFSPP